MEQRNAPADLTGQRFGKLVVSASDGAQGGKRRWVCRCDCGNLKSVRGDHLRTGATRSCGCGMAPERMDLTGQEIGRLLVLAQAPTAKTGHTRWTCRCECGNQVDVYTFALNSGRTRSCGCLAEDTRYARRGERRSASVSYRTTHKRIESTRGAATDHLCVDCGRQAQEWSYDQADPNELTETVGRYEVTYSPDPAHYDPRCVPCHRVFDGHWAFVG